MNTIEPIKIKTRTTASSNLASMIAYFVSDKSMKQSAAIIAKTAVLDPSKLPEKNAS